MGKSPKINGLVHSKPFFLCKLFMNWDLMTTMVSTVLGIRLLLKAIEH